MRKFKGRRNVNIFIFVLIGAITLGLGYAAITDIILNFNGTGTGMTNQENFNVHFSKVQQPTITENMGSASIDTTDDTLANITVTGLTKEGDKAVAEYTVINESNGIAANISILLKHTNLDYFKVTAKIDEQVLKAGYTTKLTVTVEMIKTPIETTVETKIKGSLVISPIDNTTASKGSKEVEGTESNLFMDATWEEIQTDIRNSNTEKYQVGMERIIPVNGNNYTVRIANMQTPNECKGENFSQTACGFVVEFVDEIGTYNMNSTNTNVGGWEVSEMRTYLNNTIYNNLEQALKNVIIDTKGVSGHGSTSGEVNFTTTDKLYLLSGKEVYNTDGWDTAAGYTRQLDYYKEKKVTTANYEAVIKQNNGSNSKWWLRSADSGSNTSFFSTEINGRLNDYSAAYNEYGVAPAFRIA